MKMLDIVASCYTKATSTLRVVLGTVGIVVLCGIGVASAVDQQPRTGLAISPPTFELAANPGDRLVNSLRVDNVVDIPLEVSVDTRNFTALGEEGGIDLSAEEDAYSLASWISVTPTKVTIPPRESRVFEYTIAVPQDASPGGRFGSIVFQTAPSTALSGQSGVAVSQEVGTLVFVKIAGQVTEKASIAGFQPKSDLNDKGSVGFDIRVKNEGNVHFKPKGTITISNFFGKKVATIPINQQNVLPGAIRKMDASWRGGWLFGRYNATLSLVYGKDRQVITASTAFWGFPYKFIGTAILILGIIAALLYPRRVRIWRALKILFGKE